MDIRKSFREILDLTSVMKTPRHRLSTFGQTRIKYLFASQVPNFPDRSRLREGLVIAESPKIITPDIMRNRFEGFGQESEEFGKWLSDKYGSSFRALQYKFKNEFQSTKVEYQSLKALTTSISKSLESEESRAAALIQGPDETWQVSLMKFIVDECLRSFSDNVRELDEHGYFEAPKNSEDDRRREIENLFVWAEKDKGVATLLGQRLKQYGFFKEYEDRFFSLLR